MRCRGTPPHSCCRPRTNRSPDIPARVPVSVELGTVDHVHVALAAIRRRLKNNRTALIKKPVDRNSEQVVVVIGKVSAQVLYARRIARLVTDRRYVQSDIVIGDVDNGVVRYRLPPVGVLLHNLGDRFGTLPRGLSQSAVDCDGFVAQERLIPCRCIGRQENFLSISNRHDRSDWEGG